MRALWLENRTLSLRDIPPPSPPPGESLVRVLVAGICNTDLELTRGYYPFSGVPGHEFVGVVEDGPLRGKRVVGEINAVCRLCDACRRGRHTHCDQRTVLGIKDRNGCFAEYLTLPTDNLHVVPDDLPSEIAVFTEPLAAALEIQQQIRVKAEDRVLVVGKGKLGTLIATTLAFTGCKLTVIGRDSAPVQPRAFDVVVECSGDPDGFAIARKAVRPRGTIVMKSTYAGDLTFNASSLVVDEIMLIGSRCGPFVPALQLLRERRVNPSAMIQGSYSLDDAIAAFEHAARPGTMKVLIWSAAA